MTLAAVVILYHPDQSSVIQNISTYAKHLQTVYVIDNTEAPKWNIEEEVKKISNSVYYHDGINEGIAKRLNQVTLQARNDGFTHLLTMDQDSSFSDVVFINYIKSVEAFPNQESVGMFAVNYQPNLIENTGKYIDVISSITSGSIVNLKIIQQVGGYNEDLFIDLVDADICYRIYNERIKIICFTYIILNHRLGEIIYGRSLKTFKLTPRIIHSPIRIYYIVRNVFFMLNKFQNLPQAARKDLMNTLWLLKNNILYNPERRRAISYAIKGYIDYRKNRMGKLKDKLFNLETSF